MMIFFCFLIFQVITIFVILQAATTFDLNSESLKAFGAVAGVAFLIFMTPLIWAAFAYEYYVLKTRIPNNQNQNLIHQARDEGYEEI